MCLFVTTAEALNRKRRRVDFFLISWRALKIPEVKTRQNKIGQGTTRQDALCNRGEARYYKTRHVKTWKKESEGLWSVVTEWNTKYDGYKINRPTDPPSLKRKYWPLASIRIIKLSGGRRAGIKGNYVQVSWVGISDDVGCRGEFMSTRGAIDTI